MPKSIPLPPILQQNKQRIEAIKPLEDAADCATNWKSVWGHHFSHVTDFQYIKRFCKDRITRQDISQLTQNAKKERNLIVPSFCLTMIWGYGSDSRGLYRVQEILHPEDRRKYEGVRGTIKEAYAELVDQHDLRSAYLTLTSPHGLGPSYASKFLYFVGLGCEIRPMPLILDSRVAAALKEILLSDDFSLLAQLDSQGYVQPSAESFVRYVETMDAWATELGCRADSLELFLFNFP